MRVLLDKSYLVKIVLKAEDLKKIVSIPSVNDIANLCNKRSYVIENLPEAWFSDELFNHLIVSVGYNERLLVVARFGEKGRLPKFTTEEQKIALVTKVGKAILYFPELPYKVWLDCVSWIENSDQVPEKYRTQEMIIQILNHGGKISPDLLTEKLIDAYIEETGVLDYIPQDRITLARVKKILTKNRGTKLDKKEIQGITIDEELADLMISEPNFEFIPNHLRTKAQVLAYLVYESKKNPGKYYWGDAIAGFIKRNRLLNIKFYMELIDKTGDNGVLTVMRLCSYAKIELDREALVKAYPGTIKYVNKTDQTKPMAEAVLASPRAPELMSYLSLKFITKSTSPRFLASTDESVINKISKVLKPKEDKGDPPAYSIRSGNEVELDLTDADIENLKGLGIPFVV